jgi:hypothetical protein
MTIETNNNPIHEAVLFYFGDRCPEHAEGCPACEAWKLYDEMLTNVREGESK